MSHLPLPYTGYLATHAPFPVLIDGSGRILTAQNRSPRGTLPPDAIVIHYTAGGRFDSVAVYLTKPNERNVSIHFLIGTEGETALLCPLDWIAYHAGDWKWNSRSVGIELVHPNDDSPYPPAQLDALISLCKRLAALFQIQRENVVGHRAIVATLCPRALDLDRVRDRVFGCVEP